MYVCVCVCINPGTIHSHSIILFSYAFHDILLVPAPYNIWHLYSSRDFIWQIKWRTRRDTPQRHHYYNFKFGRYMISNSIWVIKVLGKWYSSRLNNILFKRSRDCFLYTKKETNPWFIYTIKYGCNALVI